jgi:Dolichyl-phosphate-mannose-protein mannosyltransferase
VRELPQPGNTLSLKIERFSTAIVLLIAAIGILLALQGWKSRIPPFDNGAYIRSAQDLIAYGKIPDRGTMTSYASYTPPGPSWLMLPGMLLLDDPRLFESIGSAVLYAATLIGIFLLARSFFGTACGLLSVALYGLSDLGLEVAGSLVGRFSNHFFYVWMVYWVVQWVRKNAAKYLAAAIITWAAGMYVFMEVAPAIFILPVVWVLYRPPLKVQPVLLGAILAFAIWFPYLRFEYTQNWTDLKSQVLRQMMLPAHYKQSWCDPGLILRTLEVTASAPNPQDDDNVNAGVFTKLTRVLPRGKLAVNTLSSNFKSAAQIPGHSVVLALVLLFSLVLLSIPHAAVAEMIDRRSVYARWIPRCAVGMIVLGLMANEFIIARYLSSDGTLEALTTSGIRGWRTILIVVGLVLLIMRTSVAAITSQVVIAAGNISQRVRAPKYIGVLVLSLCVPWAILLLIVEYDRFDRFWWLWPLQSIFLAAFVTYVPGQLRMPRLATWAGSLLLLVMFVANPLMLSRAASWTRDGWSGLDAAVVQSTDYVASQLRSQGRDRAAVGYPVAFKLFMADFNVLNPEYKVGADLDILLKSRGVSNTNHCAEGVSRDDEFRISYVRRNWSDGQPRGYFDIRPDNSFYVLKQFGNFQVLRRR